MGVLPDATNAYTRDLYIQASARSFARNESEQWVLYGNKNSDMLKG